MGNIVRIHKAFFGLVRMTPDLTLNQSIITRPAKFLAFGRELLIFPHAWLTPDETPAFIISSQQVKYHKLLILYFWNKLTCIVMPKSQTDIPLSFPSSLRFTCLHPGTHFHNMQTSLLKVMGIRGRRILHSSFQDRF